MKLREYLKENGIVHGFFAKKLGTTSPQLSIWLGGKVKPKLEMIALIEEITKGKVSLRDWITEKPDPKQLNPEEQQP